MLYKKELTYREIATELGTSTATVTRVGRYLQGKNNGYLTALKKIKTASEITIYTDSTYVKNGITEWINNWKINGWKNANKKPVKNKDLWIELDSLCKDNLITWKWVKGHSNDKYNNLADELATKAIDY